MESISLSDDDEGDPSSKQMAEKVESGENIENHGKSEDDNGTDIATNVMTTSESLPASESNQDIPIESVSTDITTPKNIKQSENAKTIEHTNRSINASEQSEAAINDKSTSQELSNLSSDKSTTVQNTSNSIQRSELIDESESLMVNAGPSKEISSVDYKSAIEKVLSTKLSSTRNESSEPSTNEIVNEVVGDNTGKVGYAIKDIWDCDVDTTESKKHEEESENDSVQMTNRILQLEEERGKLTTEVMEKEILTLKMEKETSSLKSEISQLESMHATKLAELEKKQKQTLDQMNAKMAEVREILRYYFYFIKNTVFLFLFIMYNAITCLLPLQLKKQFVVANKEKESMVMKYALRESDIIKEKAARADSDKKVKAAFREKDEAVTKMKNAVADKTKLQLVSDSRVNIFRCFFLNTCKLYFICFKMLLY